MEWSFESPSRPSHEQNIEVLIMRTIAIVIIATLLTSTSTLAQEADAWRKVAETIPLGTKVKVQTFEGKRITGTLMRVDDKEILIKKNTRRPEPAAVVVFDDVAKIERDKDGGANVGKAIAIGLATGASVVLSLFLIAAAIAYD
jgi:hypothetical protein